MDTELPQLASWWGPIGNSLPRDEIEGWLEAFEKLDATLLRVQAIVHDVEV